MQLRILYSSFFPTKNNLADVVPRIARLIRVGEQTVYHVMSRTALDGFPLKDVEKDYLVNLFKQLGKLYFTEIMGFSVLGNHFHLLVKMLPESDFSDDDIKRRFGTYFGEKRFLSNEQIPFFRQKYASLSEFVNKGVRSILDLFFPKHTD